jgi:hypothetical protein
MKLNYGLEINDLCRHKATPNYGYARILEIDYFEKTYKVAKCKWTISKNGDHGLTKYFKLSDLIKL